MDISNMKSFSRELLYVVTRTVDGLFFLAWSVFYMFRGIFRLADGNLEGGGFNLFMPVIFLLVVIQARQSEDYRDRLNIVSLISVNAMAAILLKI